MKKTPIVVAAMFAISCSLFWALAPLSESESSAQKSQKRVDAAARARANDLEQLAKFAFAKNLVAIRQDSQHGWSLRLVDPSGRMDLTAEERESRIRAYKAIRSSPLRRDLLALSQDSVRFSESGKVAGLTVNAMRYVPPRERGQTREFTVRAALPEKQMKAADDSTFFPFSIGCSVAPLTSNVVSYPANTGTDRVVGGSVRWRASASGQSQPATMIIGHSCPDPAVLASQRLIVQIDGQPVMQFGAIPAPQGVQVYYKTEGINPLAATVRFNGRLLNNSELGWLTIKPEEPGKFTLKVTVGGQPKLITLWVSKARAPDAVFFRSSKGRTIWARSPTPFYVELAQSLGSRAAGVSDGKSNEIVVTRNDVYEQSILQDLSAEGVPMPAAADTTPFPTCAALDARTLAQKQHATGKQVVINRVLAHVPVSVTLMDSIGGEIRAMASNIRAAAVCRDSRGDYHVRSNNVDDAENPLCRGKVDYNFCAKSIGSTAKPIVGAAILAAHPDYRTLQIPSAGWKRCGDINPQAKYPDSLCSESVVGTSLLPGLGEASKPPVGGLVDWDRFMAKSLNRYAATLMALAARTKASTTADGTRGLIVPANRSSNADQLPASDKFQLIDAGGVLREYTTRPNSIAFDVAGNTEIDPREFAWAAEMRRLFAVRSEQTRNSEATAVQDDEYRNAVAVWGQALVRRRNDAVALSELMPAETNLAMDSKMNFRENYVPIILGGGNSTWSLVKLAEAYSRLATRSDVRARFWSGAQPAAVSPPWFPNTSTAPDERRVGIDSVLLSLRGVVSNGTAAALRTSVQTLESRVPPGKKLVVYAKTGTPFVESYDSSQAARMFRKLMNGQLVVIDKLIDTSSQARGASQPKFRLRLCERVVTSALRLADLTPTCQSALRNVFEKRPDLFDEVWADMAAFNELDADEQASGRGVIALGPAGEPTHTGQVSRSTYSRNGGQGSRSAQSPREGHHLVLVVALYSAEAHSTELRAGYVPSPIRAVTIAIALHEKQQTADASGLTTTLGIAKRLLAPNGVVAQELQLN